MPVITVPERGVRFERVVAGKIPMKMRIVIGHPGCEVGREGLSKARELWDSQHALSMTDSKLC